MLLLLLCSSLGAQARLVSETRCRPLVWSHTEKVNLERCDSYLQTLTHLQENADCCWEKPIEFSLLCVLCPMQTDLCSTEPQCDFIRTSPCSAQSLSSRLSLFLFKQSGKQNFFWCRLSYHNQKSRENVTSFAAGTSDTSDTSFPPQKG